MRAWTKTQEESYLRALAKADKGDTRGAIKLFRVMAKSGDAIAQHALAYALSGKKTIPSNWQEVSHWYKRSVRNGYPDSAWNLALGHAARGQLRWQTYWLKVYARMDRANALTDMVEWADTLRKRRKTNEARPYLKLAAKMGHSEAKRELRQLERGKRRG